MRTIRSFRERSGSPGRGSPFFGRGFETWHAPSTWMTRHPRNPTPNPTHTRTRIALAVRLEGEMFTVHQKGRNGLQRMATELN